MKVNNHPQYTVQSFNNLYANEREKRGKTAINFRCSYQSAVNQIFPLHRLAKGKRWNLRESGCMKYSNLLQTMYDVKLDEASMQYFSSLTHRLVHRSNSWRIFTILSHEWVSDYREERAKSTNSYWSLSVNNFTNFHFIDQRT